MVTSEKYIDSTELKARKWLLKQGFKREGLFYVKHHADGVKEYADIKYRPVHYKQKGFYQTTVTRFEEIV